MELCANVFLHLFQPDLELSETDILYGLIGYDKCTQQRWCSIRAVMISGKYDLEEMCWYSHIVCTYHLHRI